ncbi:cytochrome P450 4C1-like [Trichoplusia ni]|uniref:Cytochrome P450 4C1-like n=1 Tax=Trichoplusia ni TaxID=7111 RepID=A0A7E5VNG1_TRINI|nr:cytochrome P450 4C1-like [Trichoplusia ni]
MFVWLLLFVPVLSVLTFVYRRRNMYRLASKIPAPDDESRLFGVAHKVFGNTEEIMTTLQELSFDAMKNNGIVRAWLGPILYFILVDPVDLEMVLKTCMEKDDLHRFLRKLTGNGGIFAPVSIWRRRRKVVVPVFSPKIVEGFVNVFAERSEVMAKNLTNYSGTGKFSVWPMLSSYTLDSVCETTIGVKLNAQAESESPFLKAMAVVLHLICERIFHLWLQPDWMYKFFPQYKVHQKSLATLHNFTDEVIRKKREELRQEKESKTEVDFEYNLGAYKNKTFLDLLIHMSGGENGFTNLELREEVMTLTVAGTDTSAVAMGYTLKLLGKYPEIQEKLYQELYDVFGDSDRSCEKEDLLKLKYLERVVKESLRLFPPVPLIIRKVLQDTKLPSGRVLPAGSGIVCSIWGVHRDPKYWGPDADKFDPDRFLPERFNLAYPCSYMPFSNGPRNCVGYQYALMSVKTALSTLLRRYRIVDELEGNSTPHIRVKLDIMMKDVEDYQIALERRHPVPVNTNT